MSLRCIHTLWLVHIRLVNYGQPFRSVQRMAAKGIFSMNVLSLSFFASLACFCHKGICKVRNAPCVSLSPSALCLVFFSSLWIRHYRSTGCCLRITWIYLHTGDGHLLVFSIVICAPSTNFQQLSRGHVLNYVYTHNDWFSTKLCSRFSAI